MYLNTLKSFNKYFKKIVKIKFKKIQKLNENRRTNPR